MIVPRVAQTRLEIAGPTATRSIATKRFGACPVKMNVKLSSVGFFGSQESWSIPDVHSSRGLKAIVAIQTTGTSAITDARPINRYRPAPRNTLDRSMPSPLSLWTQYYSHDLQPRDKSNLRQRR